MDRALGQPDFNKWRKQFSMHVSLCITFEGIKLKEWFI